MIQMVWSARAHRFLLIAVAAGLLACACAPATPAGDTNKSGQQLRALPASDARKVGPQRRALLVGVSAHDYLPKTRHLDGPANDVPLLRDTLLARGFSEENIVVLAEKDAAARPTRTAILRELDRLARTAGRGDQVFVYFAGHGSQQPDEDPPDPRDPEPDRFDEIFLPTDVKRWDGGRGTVENAIVDDEIGTRVDAIRSRGAFVWLVADSCHSGTIIRGPDVGEVDRNIEPEELGIPQDLIDKAKSAAAGEPTAAGEEGVLGAQSDLPPEAGGFVAFYAAQTSEKAPERLLPDRAPRAEQKQHGLFSFMLAGVLQRYQGITYRQAAQQILHDYRAAGQAGPTPLFEGSEADMDLFTFGESSRPVRQWPIEVEGDAWHIKAGRLYQVSEGTILAVLPRPTAEDEADLLGYARIAKAGAESSVIEPVAYQNNPAPRELPSGTWARVVDARFRLGLIVTLPPRQQPLTAREQFAWRELGRLQREGVKDAAGRERVELTWVTLDASPDVRLFIRDPQRAVSEENPDGKLWFLPRSGELFRSGVGQSPAVTIPDSGSTKEAEDRFRQALADNFVKLARVKALFEIAKELSVNELADALQIELTVRPADGGETKKIALTDRPDLREGDTLGIKVTNTGKMPLDLSLQAALDLTILFIDSRSRVTPIFPRLPGQSNRLEVNGSVSLAPRVSVKTKGTESLLFIAAQAARGEERADFGFLAQDGLTLRGGPAVGLASGGATIFELLQQAGLSGEAIRGLDYSPVTLVTMRSFSWRTVSE